MPKNTNMSNCIISPYPLPSFGTVEPSYIYTTTTGETNNIYQTPSFKKEELQEMIETTIRNLFNEHKNEEGSNKITPIKFEIFMEEDGQNPSSNSLFSSVKIRIFYEGENRNGSFIEKTIGDAMLKTVYNIPIVGEFLVQKEDFGGHGGKIIISDQGVEFEETTKPFGVIPSDTRIWWETVIEKDGTEHNYACCNGLLWTGRYPEALEVVKNSKGQSMELDPSSVTGQWELKDGREYFKFTESPIISALCILGDDIEPCFESADITATKFNNLEAFKKDLNEMMQDFIIYSKEGGVQMNELEALTAKYAELEAKNAELVSANEAYSTQIADLTIQVEKLGADFAAKEVEFSAKEIELIEIQEKFAVLEVECGTLNEFKATIETEQKQELLDKFTSVLEEETISSFKEKMVDYSIEDLEKELAVLVVKKNNYSFTPQITVPTSAFEGIDQNAPEDAWIKLVK